MLLKNEEAIKKRCMFLGISQMIGLFTIHHMSLYGKVDNMIDAIKAMPTSDRCIGSECGHWHGVNEISGWCGFIK